MQALVGSVLRNYTDYTLQGKSTIRELGLAEENYSDPLFIHPPLFVYMSAFLHGYLSIPMPVIPILCQVVTLLMMPIISRYLLRSTIHVSDKNKHGGNGNRSDGSINKITTTTISPTAVAMMAMIFISCCPIAAFCSQKFWIDNALMMVVTVCAAAHMVLVHYEPLQCASNSATNRGDCESKSVTKHFLSGLLFGAIGLNCKVTALALLPFLLCWAVYQRARNYCMSALERDILYSHTHCGIDGSGTDSNDAATLPAKLASKATSVKALLVDISLHAAVFLIGTALAYAPWAYLYWVSNIHIYMCVYMCMGVLVSVNYACPLILNLNILHLLILAVLPLYS